MTSRLETFRYQKFSQFLRVSESVSKISSRRSLSIGLEEKKLLSVSKKFYQKKKSVYRSRKKVSVSASKKFSLKKSWYRFRNFLSQKKSWCWSQNFGTVMVSKILVSRLLQICPTMNKISEMSTMLSISRKCLLKLGISSLKTCTHHCGKGQNKYLPKVCPIIARPWY